MPYTFACPSCGEHLHVAPSLRGQSVNCNFCDHRVTVPARGKSKKSSEEQWGGRSFSVFTATTIGLVAFPVISILCCLGLVHLGTTKKPQAKVQGGFGLSGLPAAPQQPKEPTTSPSKNDAAAQRRIEEERQQVELEKARVEQIRLEREKLETEQKVREQEERRKKAQEDREEKERNQRQEERDIKREQEELLAEAKSREPQLRNIKVHSPAIVEQPAKNSQSEPVRGRLYWVTGEKTVVAVGSVGFSNRKKVFNIHVFVTKGDVKTWQSAKGGYDTVNPKEFEVIIITELPSTPDTADKTKAR